MKNFYKLFRYVKPYWVKVIISLSFNAASAIFSVSSIAMIIPFLGILFDNQPIVPVRPEFEFSINTIRDIFNYEVNEIIVEKGRISAVVFVSIIIVILSFFKNGLHYTGSYILAPVRNGIVKDIRNALFDKILKLHMGFFSDEKKGDVMSKMTTDVNEVEQSVIRSLDFFFREPILIIVYLSILFSMSVNLTLFVILLLPLSGIFIGRIGRSLRKTSVKIQESMGYLMSIMEESLGGLRIIKAFNAEDNVQTKFRKENNNYVRLMVNMWRRRYLASPLSEFLGTVVLIFVMWYGVSLVFKDNSTLSSQAFIGYLAIFSQIINPSKAITNAYYGVLRGMAAADRIDMIMAAENKIVEVPDAKPIEKFIEAIEYRSVYFKYTHEDVLKNVNLTIPKGKTIALVGQSGSGKSTIADLLPRFYDVIAGEILIDGINIKTYKIKDLRNLIGNVNQDPILFNDTFYNNIAFGVERTTEQAVIEAAKVANAHEFIENTPEGYHTNIGDRGSKLSGGQRQRVSIARAVLKNPPIMILDEATSALDTESERLVQDALTNLMKNRTTLVIAHRLSTVQHADEICVVHDGEIVERGKHHELLEKKGVYKKLHDLQMFE
jgi:ATP-binding cassette, subfamily B, bacterial MsbA